MAAGVLIFVHQKRDGGRFSNGGEAAANTTSFNMQYSDRLVGVPVTGVESNSSTIEVTYGDAGYSRKTLGVKDNSDSRNDLTEQTAQSIGGYDVTLKGKNGSYYLATWTYNSFAYTISISDAYNGADLSEMTEYILSTR
ncbi:MAG: hypothetical protein IKD72_11145 [Clostridia bacterium]|nr:hypothetical protein [Clostridia bacterium]